MDNKLHVYLYNFRLKTRNLLIFNIFNEWFFLHCKQKIVKKALNRKYLYTNQFIIFLPKNQFQIDKSKSSQTSDMTFLHPADRWPFPLARHDIIDKTDLCTPEISDSCLSKTHPVSFIILCIFEGHAQREEKVKMLVIE